MSLGHLYVLVDPRDGEIRYVGWTGRTFEQRLAEHMYSRASEHNHRTHWLAHLKRMKLLPILRPLQTVSIAEVANAERYWISYFRVAGCSLVNGTNGGEGALGRRVSAETRAKISATKAAKPARLSAERRAQISIQMKNRVITSETRAKLSALNKGRVNGPEARVKQAAALRGRSVPQERRERISKSLKALGIKRSAEYRQKQSFSQLRRYQDPAQRLRQSTQQRGHPVAEETRQKIRDFWAKKRSNLDSSDPLAVRAARMRAARAARAR